ncbi:MAG: hypothetical protein MRZ79_13660 [Bacteroidia bacterium]|nr:hypothetical protein [Bacteroidia bacterium]
MDYFGDTLDWSEELREEIEDQLFDDLIANGWTDIDDLYIDWSEALGEGSWTKYKGTIIQDYSGIGINNSKDEMEGNGWISFVYIQEADSLTYFWDNLHKGSQVLKEGFGIPPHIWNELPKSYQKSEFLLARKQKNKPF